MVDFVIFVLSLHVNDIQKGCLEGEKYPNLLLFNTTLRRELLKKMAVDNAIIYT